MKRNNAEFITEKLYQAGVFSLNTKISGFGAILGWLLSPSLAVHKKPLWVWGLASTERPLEVFL